MKAIYYIVIPCACGLFLLLNGSTNVYVSNCTPFAFQVLEMKQTKGNSLNVKKYQRRIDPWQQKVQILEFPRDKGIKNKTEYVFEEVFQSTSFPDVSFVLNQKEIGNIMRLGKPMSWGVGLKSEKFFGWYDDEEISRSFNLAPDFTLTDNDGNKQELKIRIDAIGTTWNDLVYIISGRNKPNTYETPSTTGDSTKINILVWNLYLMTVDMPIIGRVYAKPAIDERAACIATAIGNNYDVLILPELWDDNARTTVLKGLKQQGYKYASCILGAGFLWEGNGDKYRAFDVSLEQPMIIYFDDPRFGTNKLYTQAGNGLGLSKVSKYGIFGGKKVAYYMNNGGVIIVSKWPIEVAREVVYKDANEREDIFAKKGAVYVRINKEDKKYHVFGTHPDTDVLVRPKQLAVLKKFIDAQEIPADEPVLIGGDMNVDKKTFEYDQMLTQLNVTFPELIGDEMASIDPYKNFLNHGQKGFKLLDYIMYANNHQKPTNSWTQVRILTATSWGEKVYDLSDHYAIFGYFEFQD